MLIAFVVIIDSRRNLLLLGTLVVCVLPLLALGDAFRIDPPKAKWLGLVRNRKRATVFSGWSSLSKVNVFRNPDRNFIRGCGLWGLSRSYSAPHDGPLIKRLGVTIDSSALTTIIRYPQDLELFDYLPACFIHHLGNSYARSLHIGAGGGIDLLAAHHYGVSKVHGVEINLLIVKIVKTQFDDYAGGIYTGHLDGVHIHLGEGRSFLECSTASDAYDLIQLSGVDTSSSPQAGAYALSENNLYTTEAFVSYLSHLRPGGILTLTRWHFPDQEGRKTFSLRLVNLVRAALRQLGLDPDGRVFFLPERQTKGDYGHRRQDRRVHAGGVRPRSRLP